MAKKRAFSRFEKWALGSVGVGLVALAVALAIALSGPPETSARGCVDVTITGATGAALIHQCGANARSLCRDAGRPKGYTGETGRQIQAVWRQDGFAVG